MTRREPIPPFTKRGEKFDRVRVAPAAGRGLGVFATSALKLGRAVGRVRGELHSADYRSDYCVGFGDQTLEPAPPYRFLNHSCEPNCEFVEWELGFDGENAPILELWLHALRDVAPNEELTIDYGWGWEAAIPCRCGAPTCRGWICKEDELEICRRERETPPSCVGDE